MKASKTKAPPIYGDDLPITAFQIKEIRKNCNFQEDTKEEWVQWVTGDVARTSLKSLTQAQAVRIICQQTGSKLDNEFTEGGRGHSKSNWGLFDKNNNQHKRIQSDLRQANIVVKNERWGEVADMGGWFDRFLKSDKSPVKKPLKSMTPLEVSKIIKALDNVVIWKNIV